MPVLAETRDRMSHQGLSRPRRGKLVAGVCAGIGRRFGVSAALVRLAFVISLLLPGPQLVAYLGLWVVMPREQRLSGELPPRA